MSQAGWPLPPPVPPAAPLPPYLVLHIDGDLVTIAPFERRHGSLSFRNCGLCASVHARIATDIAAGRLKPERDAVLGIAAGDGRATRSPLPDDVAWVRAKVDRYMTYDLP